MYSITGLFGGIVYSIEGVESASFSVVAATGVISNIAGLDRETNEVIDLIYVATDTDPAHPRRTSVPLIITLADINDQTPAFLSIPTPCAFDVPEGVGYVVVVVVVVVHSFVRLNLIRTKNSPPFFQKNSINTIYLTE